MIADIIESKKKLDLLKAESRVVVTRNWEKRLKEGRERLRHMCTFATRREE